MPDFEARIHSGASTAVWSDPTAPWTRLSGSVPITLPSRLNPNPTHPHTYWRVTPPSTVELRAKVNGVDTPLDTALGGRLFQAAWAQRSGTSPPSIVQTPGQSSVATVALTSAHLGFFLLLFWRPQGGAVAIPFNVEA